MPRLAVLTLALVLIASALGGSSARAYETIGWPKWDHSCLTTDGDPRLVAALDAWAAVSGVRNCGTSGSPDLAVGTFWRDTTPAIVGYSYPNPPRRDGPMVRCTVYVRPTWERDTWVWLHEVGHCLGLDHSADPNQVMYPAESLANWTTLGADDVAGIHSIFGRPTMPFRLSVSGVAR